MVGLQLAAPENANDRKTKGFFIMQVPRKLIKSGFHSASLTLLLLGLAACSPNMQQRGNKVEAEKLSRIVVGQTPKTEVESLLGSPSYQSPYTNTWYYATTTQRYTAFLKPETTEARVVTISFDEAGVVNTLTEQTPQQADAVEASNRKIKAIDEKPPIFQQLFGNIGKFVKPKSANP
jgi:outer membrane protein assembly factor BamE (lipoprotein component of BamABCDE complex)